MYVGTGYVSIVNNNGNNDVIAIYERLYIVKQTEENEKRKRRRRRKIIRIRYTCVCVDIGREPLRRW